MGELLNIITPLHKSTKRDYLKRMQDEKIHCSEIARKYDREFWDGDRRYGYGGYRYDGRWQPIAKALVEKYDLSLNASILDVGCGKGFLLYEFKQLLADCTVAGFDVSRFALENAKEEIRGCLFQHRAQDKYPFKDKEFDLVISTGTLHNNLIHDLRNALQEIERVGRNKYVLVEAYRNVEELFNLQCWALTCESFFRPEEWVWLFNEFKYSGDYEFIYFE